MFLGCGNTKQNDEIDKQEILDLNVSNTNIIQESISKNLINLTASETTVKTNKVVSLRTETYPSIVEYQWWDENGDLLSCNPETTWTAPDHAGHYTLTLTVFDAHHTPTHKNIKITVEIDTSTVLPDKADETPIVRPSGDSNFLAIHRLLEYANNGLIHNVTYICIGDSTRAKSKHHGRYIFHDIRDRLKQYNVKSHLLARAGHEISQFVDESAYPTWRDTVALIPGNGQNCIVDICLGINDYWNLDSETIKPNIRAAIRKIRARKPQTHFVLTMPNRVYDDKYMTNKLKYFYQSLAKELGLPLNNIVRGVMPTQDSTPYRWYRDDGFNVHMSREGQDLVAQFILENLLP